VSVPIGPWNWLEIVKLAISFSTPVVVLILGLWIKGLVDRIDQRRWIEQSTIKWRLSVFERFAPKLNMLLSIFTYVGRWKEFQPPEIIGLKRDLDELVFTYYFLWSESFRENYQRLMDACFEVNQGPGRDAKITGNVEMFRQAHKNWDARWDDLFVPADARARRGDIRRLVEVVLSAAIRDLGLNLRQFETKLNSPH
jgi:hypothetical protein